MMMMIIIIIIMVVIIIIIRKQAEDPEREVDVETLLPGDLDENLNRWKRTIVQNVQKKLLNLFTLTWFA